MAAEDNSSEKNKPRRERRKEARAQKNQRKLHSWLQRQKSEKLKKSLSDSNPVHENKSQNDVQLTEKTEVMLISSKDEVDHSIEQSPLLEDGIKSRIVKRKKNSVKKAKSKFNEYLEMEMGGGPMSAKDDLRLERRLAKKLKVRDGKLRRTNDDIDTLLEGIPSVLGSLPGEESPERLQTGSLPEKVTETLRMGEEIDGQKEYENVSEESDSSGASFYSDEDIDELPKLEELKKTKRKKTKFEEYLEAETRSKVTLLEDDLAMERKLSKKLKVKAGKLSGDDEGVSMLLEGVPSVLDSLENGKTNGVEVAPTMINHNCSSLGKREKTRAEVPSQELKSGTNSTTPVESELQSCGPKVDGKVHTAVQANIKYVVPHRRSRGGNESEEQAQIRRRLRGLLNRLSESNVESITGEISTILHSVGRSIGSQIVSEEVLSSCSEGPPGNEQYAAVFAAFVAGMSCLVGIDFGAKLLASLAKCFQDEYLEEDNLSLRNVTLLLSYLYVFGVCSSDLMYDFLIMLSKRLTEIDVSTILTVLKSCGMKLRGEDPVGMKNFILSVQNKANELKMPSEDGQAKTNSRRMEFMLETICDIKNNKTRTKEDTVQLTRIKKWLQKLRVDEILLRGVKWSKLFDPDKKGQWWLSGDIASTTNDDVKEVASTIDKEMSEAQKMLQLAASQRMNTDARRAVFCVIMSGEDYIDAFEKLSRLHLPGKQDREIMRVLVECCLQEKVFNKYYCVLASKLCSHDKNHKFSLQYCLWDHFKELESMELIRSMHLSKFVAEMIASFSISLAVLKAVDLSDSAMLTPKRIMHFRMLFEAVLELPDKRVWNIFTRIALASEYESLRDGIVFFISKYVASNQKSLFDKFKLAKKALNNVEGILM